MSGSLFKKFDLEKIILSPGEIKLFPSIDDRESWDKLPAELKIHLLKKARAFADFNWGELTAAGYLEYKRSGNRSSYEDLYFKKRYALGILAIAECVENRGRFDDGIINGIWSICEETTWVIPAHNGHYSDEPLADMERPSIDLFAAETGALLATLYRLMKEKLDIVTPVINKRMLYELGRRILDPYLERNDFWWMNLMPSDRGINNWNPWCNSNCLLSFVQAEGDKSRLTAAVKKCIESISVFMDSYDEDGGCNEGVSYWTRAGACLFDCLEILSAASGGKIDLYDDEKTANIGRFVRHCHIHENYFINYADGGAKIAMPADLIWRYGRRIFDQELVNLGSYLFHRQPVDAMFDYCFSIGRSLRALFDYEEIAQTVSIAPYSGGMWLPGIEVMASRERNGSSEGLFLSAKGGHNGENHNHNDVGNFIVYSDGYPVIIDAGVGTYTAKTFSDRRYEIWTMQSQYHNLPLVNGYGQMAGKDRKAEYVIYHDVKGLAEFSLDIAGAYPESAEIKSWKRKITMNKTGASISVSDIYEMRADDNEIICVLMTPCVTEPAAGGIVFHCNSGKDVFAEYDADNMSCEVEVLELDDVKLIDAWGDKLYRVLLKIGNAPKTGALTIKFKQYERKPGL